MTDPIADFLTRIKNAHMARHDVVRAPFSKLKKALADILLAKGYVAAVSVTSDEKPELVVELKYVGKKPALHTVKRISKPGRRVYASAKDVPKALSGYGITIVSTSKGVMTDTDARKLNIGGEVMCQIW